MEKNFESKDWVLVPLDPTPEQTEYLQRLRQKAIAEGKTIAVFGDDKNNKEDILNYLSSLSDDDDDDDVADYNRLLISWLLGDDSEDSDLV